MNKQLELGNKIIENRRQLLHNLVLQKKYIL